MELGATNIKLGELKVQAPSRFRIDAGEKLDSAHFLFAEYDYAKRFPLARKGSKAEGLRFERKVLEAFSAAFPDFISSLPLRYYLKNSKRGTVIPDGLLAQAGRRPVLVEIKLRHTVSAWFQLRLYSAAVRAAVGESPRRLEVVKWFDPEVRFPEPALVTSELERFLSGEEDLGVLIWR